jgi:hypothetical protein
MRPNACCHCKLGNASLGLHTDASLCEIQTWSCQLSLSAYHLCVMPWLQVNTTTARGRNAPKTAVIGIGYLTDYDGLGQVRNPTCAQLWDLHVVYHCPTLLLQRVIDS